LIVRSRKGPATSTDETGFVAQYGLKDPKTRTVGMTPLLTTSPITVASVPTCTLPIRATVLASS
jgi:hypothetical protein